MVLLFSFFPILGKQLSESLHEIPKERKEGVARLEQHLAMKSGLFNYDAVEKKGPAGYTKVCEGTTAILEPPPKDARWKGQPPVQRDEDENRDIELEDQAIFYNPAQVVNRDLSISAIETFSRLRLREPRRRGGTVEGIKILEALSATGLRAIRYYKEISNVRYIIANDMDSDAVECIVRNCAFNDVPVCYPTLQENMETSFIEVYSTDDAVRKSVPPATSCETGSGDGSAAPAALPLPGEVGVRSGGAILPNLDDANDLMCRLAMNPGVHPDRRLCFIDTTAAGTSTKPLPLLQQDLMDVVDLDPYGSASPFLDGAFRCIKEGGLMLVTSTDSAILCGNFPDTAHAKYNTIPYKGSHCHEAAVRVLLACIERAANKHKKYIVPLLSLHIDFYVRCFFRVYTQPAEVKLSACKLGYQLQCSNCPAFWVRPMATVRRSRPSRVDRRRAKKEAQAAQRRDGCKRPRDGNIKGEEATNSTASSIAGVCDEVSKDAELVPITPFPVVAAETYPASPDRHVSPKIHPFSLQQLPQLHHATAENPGDAGSSRASSNSCPVCGGAVIFSGPLYAAPTQDNLFLKLLLGVIDERAEQGRINAEARITGLVRTAMEELPDCPLFYLLSDVASYVRVRCPPTPCFVAALARLGYHCSQVHCTAAGLKTDCPPEVLFRVMAQWQVVQEAHDRELERKAAVEPSLTEKEMVTEAKESTHTNSSGVGRGPLLVTPLPEADFTYDKAYDFRRQVTGVAKFIPNAPGWGPKRRHQGAAPLADEMGLQQ